MIMPSSDTEDGLLLLDERCRILGLQLHAARLQCQVAFSMRHFGSESPERIARAAVASGLIAKQRVLTLVQLQQLSTIRDRLASSLTASSSRGPTVQVLGKGRPRAHAAAAHEHLKEWCEQQAASLANLEDLSGDRQAGVDGEECGSFMTYLRQEHQAGSSPCGAPPPFAWAYPVAHIIGTIPEQVAGVVAAPLVAYPHLGAPGSCCGEGVAGGAAGLGGAGGPASWTGGILWNAAPLITDPSTGQQLFVARHANLEQALLMAGEGDVLLLSPGRYNMPDEASVIRRSVRMIGMGITQQDVVLFNNADDDGFMECHGKDVVLENLTMLQLGGYDGIVQVPAGCTTLIDCSLQCSSSGSAVWLRNTGTLIMHNCKVTGSSSSAIQVEAGGTRLEMYGCEVTGCGHGDDVVPKDLGAIDVQVRLRPLAASGLPVQPPVLTSADLTRLCKTSHCNAEYGEGEARPDNDLPAALVSASTVAAPAAPSAAPAAPAAVSGAFAPPAPPAAPAVASSSVDRDSSVFEAAVAAVLCQLDEPATVIIGPGCKIHGNRGFALSIVKPRSVALYHEAAGGTGSAGSGSPAAASASTGKPAAGAASIGKPSSPAPAASAVAAALEGVNLYVHSSIQLGGNTRGALGVVDAEYADMDGDEVNTRTTAKNFHAVQLSARQLREGFCSRSADWAPVRSACCKHDAASIFRRGPSIMRGAPSALRKQRSLGGTRARAAGGGTTAGAPSGLRVLVCKCYLRAARKEASAAAGSSIDGVDQKQDSSGSSESCSSDEDSALLSEECGRAPASAAGSAETVKPQASGSGNTAGGSSSEQLENGHSPVLQPSLSIASISPRGLGGATGEMPRPRHAPPAHLPSPLGSGRRADGEEFPGPTASPINSMLRDPPGSVGEAAATTLKSCWACGLERAAMKKCSACRRACYCSAACQTSHWRTHKSGCSVWASEGAQKLQLKQLRQQEQQQEQQQQQQEQQQVQLQQEQQPQMQQEQLQQQQQQQRMQQVQEQHQSTTTAIAQICNSSQLQLHHAAAAETETTKARDAAALAQEATRALATASNSTAEAFRALMAAKTGADRTGAGMKTAEDAMEAAQAAVLRADGAARAAAAAATALRRGTDQQQ